MVFCCWEPGIKPMNKGLAIVIPTFNENENITVLVERLQKVLSGIRWEIIFVDDDSSDGTLDTLEKTSEADSRIRFIRRVGRRGLSSACIEGMMATNMELIAVMDADLQHDEAVLPEMFNILTNKKEIDCVIASRFLRDSKVNNLSPTRRQLSLFGNWIANNFFKVNFSDPLSGFFMIRRGFINQQVQNLSGKGFKILLDILTSTKGRGNFTEIPLTFRERHAGKSKLDNRVKWEFLLLLIDKLFKRYLPIEFIMFIVVGTFGALFHLLILSVSLFIVKITFMYAQSIAALSAMVLNFTFNNIFTYSDYKLRGTKFIKGLLSFCCICSVGAVINIKIALYLYNLSVPWWLAGLIGTGIGSVWNFFITRIFTWRIFVSVK
jgi:dolichol-phosphate mannosyltransferase